MNCNFKFTNISILLLYIIFVTIIPTITIILNDGYEGGEFTMFEDKKIDIEGGEFFIEKDIYKFVNKNKLFCLLSYHHMVFNNNKIKKFFYKVRTLFFQLSVNKLYPSKKIGKLR